MTVDNRGSSDIAAVSFDAAPEMSSYLTPPRGMYIGAPGKHGYLSLGFELDAGGKSILRELDRRAPLIVQQALYFDEELPEMPCVYILSSGGPNIDGDRYTQKIRVCKNAMAYVSTGAATKLAEMKDNYVGMSQMITVEDGGYLEYLPEPIIPCRHARFISDTRIVIHPSATLVYAETYLCGRKFYKDGERFCYDILSISMQGERFDGRLLFREKFVIEPFKTNLQSIGVMNGNDVFANVIVLTPEEQAQIIYEKTEAYIKRDIKLSAGITQLPNHAGLLFKVIGRETKRVKAEVRKFCSTVREVIKGVPLPAEFPWR